MTHRERRERKAERLRGWAAKRQSDATAVLKAHQVYRGDHAFNFQPGHIPERARVIAQDDRAFRSMQKADRMESKATNIERQLDRSIYDDDPDARERLAERITQVEATLARMKQANAAYKRGGFEAMAAAGFTEAEVTEARRTVATVHWKPMPFPFLTNTSAELRRNKQRIARLEREAVEGKPWTYYAASKYPGKCVACYADIALGSAILYRRGEGSSEVKHFKCPGPPTEANLRAALPCEECGGMPCAEGCASVAEGGAR